MMDGVRGGGSDDVVSGFPKLPGLAVSAKWGEKDWSDYADRLSAWCRKWTPYVRPNGLVGMRLLREPGEQRD